MPDLVTRRSRRRGRATASTARTRSLAIWAVTLLFLVGPAYASARSSRDDLRSESVYNCRRAQRLIIGHLRCSNNRCASGADMVVASSERDYPASSCKALPLVDATSFSEPAVLSNLSLPSFATDPALVATTWRGSATFVPEAVILPRVDKDRLLFTFRFDLSSSNVATCGMLAADCPRRINAAFQLAAPLQRIFYDQSGVYLIAQPVQSTFTLYTVKIGAVPVPTCIGNQIFVFLPRSALGWDWGHWKPFLARLIQTTCKG